MKSIKVSNADCYLLVDDEDFDRISKFTWTKANTNSISRMLSLGGFQKRISIAAEVMQQDKMYDHIDRDYLNNSKTNLRECNCVTNGGNRTKQKNRTSIYKGVCFIPKNGKWQANIQFKRKPKYLGQFLTEKEAAKAYNDEAVKLFKEFANLNKDENGQVI